MQELTTRFPNLRARSVAPLWPVLGLALTGSACAVPVEGPGEGPEVHAGRADGRRAGCSVELSAIEEWNNVDKADCTQKECDFHFVIKVDVDEDLAREGYEPFLAYRQQKPDSCVFGCDPEEGTADYADEIRGAPSGKQRFRIHWRFDTTSDAPLELTLALRDRNGDRHDGATYEIDLQNYPESRYDPANVSACESQGGAGLDNVAFYDIRDDLRGNARCQRSGQSIDGRLVFDDAVRSGEARDLCVTATSADEDAASPVVRVHYRLEGQDDFRSVRAESLYEDRPDRFVGTYALDLGELDPFDGGACDPAGETAELEYYVAVEGQNAETQLPAGNGTATVEYRCAADDTPLPPSRPSREGYEVFEAGRLPAPILDASADLHSRSEAYSPMCHDGEDGPGVRESAATLEVPDGFGDVEWAEAVVEVSHHYHGDLWMGIQRRIHSGARWGDAVTLASCDLPESGYGSAVSVSHSFDVTSLVEAGPRGEWRILVRDYGHDYSGYDEVNFLEAFELRLMPAD